MHEDEGKPDRSPGMDNGEEPRVEAQDIAPELFLCGVEEKKPKIGLAWRLIKGAPRHKVCGQ